MFVYTFYTWLLANIIHPVFLIGYVGVLHRQLDFANFGEQYFLILFLSVILSFPAFLLGWIVLSLIRFTNFTITIKFLAWLFIVPFLIVLSLWSMTKPYTNGFFDAELLMITIPAILSAWTSSAFRYKQFQKLIYNKIITNNETELV